MIDSLQDWLQKRTLIDLKFMIFSVTPIQSNPKGTDTFVTLLSGSQHWILIPTTEKKDLEKISCGSPKENNDCQKGSWIGHIFPQVLFHNHFDANRSKKRNRFKRRKLFLMFIKQPSFLLRIVILVKTNFRFETNLKSTAKPSKRFSFSQIRY